MNAPDVSSSLPFRLARWGTLLWFWIGCLAPQTTWAVVAPPANQNLLVVRGTIYQPDGKTPAADGLLVTVSNQNRGLMQRSLTGVVAGPGQYVVTFLNIDQPAAAEGDTIVVSVEAVAGKTLGQKERKLLAKDVQSNLLMFDLTLSKTSEPPSPTINRYLFVIRGTVFGGSDGATPQNGLELFVTNPARGLSQRTISGSLGLDGMFATTFLGIKDFVVDLGDKWTVRVVDASQNTLGEASATVTKADLETNYFILNVVLSQSTGGTQLLAVRGTVFAPDGKTPAGNGLEVTVENVSKGLLRTDKTGTIGGPSEYVVSFLDIHSPVAEAGDTIRIRVSRGTQVLGETTVVLTAADIAASMRSADAVLSVAPGVLMGDVTGNGTVSAADAARILRHVSNIETLSPTVQAAADVDGDGNISANDAQLVLKFVVGRLSHFPANP